MRKQVGSAAEILPQVSKPEVAIDRIHEKLGLLSGQQNIGEIIIQKDAESARRKGTPVDTTASLPTTNYTLTGDASGETYSTPLHAPYVGQVRDAIRVVGQSYRKQAQELSDTSRANRELLRPEEISWRKVGAGEYISYPKYLDRRQVEMVNEETTRLANLIEGQTYNFKVTYTENGDNVPKGVQVSRRAIRSLVNSIAKDPQKAVSNYVGSKSGVAKPLVDLLQDIKGQFQSLESVKEGGIRLKKDKDNKWRRYYKEGKELKLLDKKSFTLLEATKEGRDNLKAKEALFNEFIIKVARDRAKSTREGAWVETRKALKDLKGSKKGERTLNVSKKEMDDLVASMSGTDKNEYEGFINKVLPSARADIGGAKALTQDDAATKFAELIRPAVAGQQADLFVDIADKAEKEVRTRILALTGSHKGAVPTRTEGEAWTTAVNAILSDLNFNLKRLDKINPAQKTQDAQDNLTTLANYNVRASNNFQSSTKTFPTLRVEKDTPYFSTTGKTSVSAHLSSLKLRAEQTPLTVGDANITKIEGKTVPDANAGNLKGEILKLKGNREMTMLGQFPEGAVIKIPNIKGLRQGLPTRGEFKKLKPGNGTPFSEFLKIANEEEGSYYAVDSYFHVEDKDGNFVFTNHPFHMASYFSTGQSGDSQGVTKYPEKFPIPEAYKGKGAKKLHPGFITKDGFIIGAATSFPVGMQKSHDGRAVVTSYVMAHTTEDEDGNSTGGITLSDLHDHFTPFEKRTSSQENARGVDTHTIDLNDKLTPLEKLPLGEAKFLADHEIAFLLPGIPSKYFEGGKKPSVKQVMSGNYNYPKFEGDDLISLISNTVAKLMRLDNKNQYADKKLREIAAGRFDLDAGLVTSRFIPRFLLSMLKTRLAVVNPNIGRLGGFREASSKQDIINILRKSELSSNTWEFKEGKPRQSPAVLPKNLGSILLSVLDNRANMSGQGEKDYLLGSKSPVRLLGSAKNLKDYEAASKESTGGVWPDAKNIVHDIASDVSRTKQESTDTATDKRNKELADRAGLDADDSESDSIASVLFGPKTPFEGINEKTRAELTLRVMEEIRVLGIEDGNPDSLRIALLKIKDGSGTGLYPAHYGKLADILLNSGKLDFDKLTLEVTDRINSAGKFIPGIAGGPGKVVINSSATNPRGVHDLVIHELLHAAFDKVLSDPKHPKHQLIVDAIDALIDRGRSFYGLGEINRMGAQKRAEFQAKREADNYSLDIIKNLINESDSALKNELPENPQPSDFRGVYRDIRTEELKANRYYDDVIQLRHAFGINPDGSFIDDEVARKEFFAHLLTDPTTQWYLKEIDRISPRGSSWDKAVRMVTRGISEDERDYSDGIVSAFLTLTGNENYEDIGATKTLYEIIGHTKEDKERADSYREKTPAFSSDFDPDASFTHGFSKEVNKSLTQLGEESPVKKVSSALGLRLRVVEDIADPTTTSVPGEVAIPASPYREKKLVSTMVSASYDQAFTTGQRATVSKLFLENESLQEHVQKAGSWSNLVGQIVADAYYGDVDQDFTSAIQTLRADILMRNLGIGAANHVETMLEVLGRITPEKKSFLSENYRSENSQSQWDSGEYVGDKINAERAIEEYELDVTAEDYLSAKESANAYGLTLTEYLDDHADVSLITKDALKTIEGYVLVRLEEYKKNKDSDEQDAIELQKLEQGLPHDASVEDVLESKKSEAYGDPPPLVSRGASETGFLYHVTTTRGVESLFNRGITPGSGSNWETEEGKPYGAGAVFAFDNVRDAIQWAMRMEANRWDKEAGHREMTGVDERPMGYGLEKGLFSVVRFKRGSKWAEDKPPESVGAHGRFWTRKDEVSAQDITSRMPITQDLVDQFLSTREGSDEDFGSVEWTEGAPPRPPRLKRKQARPRSLESKKSEAYEGDEEVTEEEVTEEEVADEEIAEEVKNNGARSLKPKLLSRLWSAIKSAPKNIGKSRPFSAEIDPLHDLSEESPSDEQKALLGVANSRIAQALTVRGKGGAVLHEHAKELRGGINKWVTKAQLFSSSMANQLRKQYNVNSIGELAATWDDVELSRRWALPENKTAGAHLAELINMTQGHTNDAALVDRFFPTSELEGKTQREAILLIQERSLQKFRSARHRADKAYKEVLAGSQVGAGELSAAKEKRRVAMEAAKKGEEDARSVAQTAILQLYARSAEAFREDQKDAFNEIARLDRAYLATQGKEGVELTPANSLWATLFEQRASNTALQQELLGSGLLEQQMAETNSNLLPANSFLENIVAKITASNDVYLTTTYQLNDEKRNYMEWLSTKDPEARRRWKIAYDYYRDLAITEKAEKMAKETDYSVSEARSLIKLQSDPIPHEEIVTKIRNFIQTFGSKGVESSTLGMMNAKVLTPPKDIPENLQEVAGIYADNIFNAARTMTTLGTTVANQKFLTSMKESLERIQDEVNKERKPGESKVVLLSSNSSDKNKHNLRAFKQEGVTGNFGPLQDMYGPPLLVDAFHELGRKNHGGIQRALMRISSFTMANVTTRRPRTHFRNFVGNPMFLVNAGMPLHAVKSLKRAFSVVGLGDKKWKGLGGDDPVMKAAVMGARDQIESLGDYSQLTKAGKVFVPFLSAIVASTGDVESILEPEMAEILEEYATRLVTGQDVRTNVIRETRKSVLNSGGGDPVFGISMVPGTKTRKVQRELEAIDKVAEGMYGAEDDYWKAAAYEMQLTKLAKVFGITDIDPEQKFSPIALRKAIKGMSSEQAQRILDTFEPRTEEQRKDRKDALKDNRAGVAMETLQTEAAYRVQKTMPNYSMTVSLVKWMKRNDMTAFVAPFISFYAEVYRLAIDTPKLAFEEIKLGNKSGNSELTKMGYNRMLWYTFTLTSSTSVLGYFWSVLGALVSSIGDDEEDDLTAKSMEVQKDNIDDTKAVKRFMHEWYQKATLAFFGKDKRGNPVVMDVSHMFPLAGFVDPITQFGSAMVGKREVAEGLVDPRVPGIGGAWQELAVDLFGRYLQPQMWAQALLGDRYRASDSDSEFETKIGDPMGQIIGEGAQIAFPGYVTDLFKLGSSAMNAGKVRGGRVVSPGKELMSALFGVKWLTIDVKEQYERTIGKRQKQLRNANWELNRILRGSDTVSKEEVEAAIAKRDQRAREIIVRAIRDYDAAKRYRPDVNALLHNKGAKSFRSQVRGRFFVPPRPSSNDLRIARKNSIERGDSRMEALSALGGAPEPLTDLEVDGPLERGPVDSFVNTVLPNPQQ